MLGAAGWIGDAVVVDAPSETIGDGLMGVCARATGSGSTARFRRRRAASSASSRRRTRPPASSWRRPATATSCASTSTSRHSSRSARRAAPTRRSTTRVGSRSSSRTSRRCNRGTSCAAAASSRSRPRSASSSVSTRRSGTHPSSRRTSCFAGHDTLAPDLIAAGLGAVVPGFLDRYGAAFSADEVGFYERLAGSAANWFAARPGARTLAHSDFRPDNLLLFSDELFSNGDTGPAVAVVDWQGFQRRRRDGGRLVRGRQRARTGRCGAPTRSASCAATTPSSSPPA